MGRKLIICYKKDIDIDKFNKRCLEKKIKIGELSKEFKIPLKYVSLWKCQRKSEIKMIEYNKIIDNYQKEEILDEPQIKIEKEIKPKKVYIRKSKKKEVRYYIPREITFKELLNF